MNFLPTDIAVPCEVPERYRQDYIANYLSATRHTGRLMLFAGDQKIEHLNDDFYDTEHAGTIAKDDADPEHLFHIANEAEIGVFAAQLGLINRYGRDYSKIRYLAKLNSKSHLVGVDQQEPLSRALWSINDVVRVRQTGKLNIVGVGYTCYLGSEYESQMLAEAAQVIAQAHAHGLLAVIWMYPRGKSVSDEKSPHLLAGACGAAVCLGADFVKVNFPQVVPNQSLQACATAFQEAVAAAGRTGVICAGGSGCSPLYFFQQLHAQIHISGVSGSATGRNIHQKNRQQAIRFCNAIAAIILGNQTPEFALEVYQGQQEFHWIDHDQNQGL